MTAADSKGRKYNITADGEHIIIPPESIANDAEYIEISDSEFCARAGDEGCYIIADVEHRGSRPHITEMFENVISNAIDALTAANKPEKIIKITSLCEDGLCLITVYDNGCGIDRRHIKKIFGLFYTTKPPATNSEIGLNYVRNVLHMHRCDMRIRSVRGEYTAVDIVFPLPKDARSFTILPQTSFFAD